MNGPFTDEQLIGVLARLIQTNDLHRWNREDTIGILMRCGAFHEGGEDPDHFVVELARAINMKMTELKG